MPPIPAEPVYQMTVEQYHAAVRAGVFTEDDPIELLEGVLVQKMPKNPPHVLALAKLQRALAKQLAEAWSLRAQEPVTLADGEPEPDLALVRGCAEDYAERHPGSEDVALVVEVAGSTLDRDRGIKLRSYARASLPVYWIVNLVDRCIEVYSAPVATASTPTYRTRATYGAGEVVDVVIDDVVRAQVRVDDVLP